MPGITLQPALNDFFIVLFSILVEGIPFILIGAVLSGVVEFWVSEEMIGRVLPKKKRNQFLVMSVLGNLFPVCECGNVPFARRMIKKNIPPYLALTFLLSAPVLNPIVIVATLAAFSHDVSIVGYRLLFTVIVAVSVGYLFSFLPREEVLKKEIDEGLPHHHHHDHGDCPVGSSSRFRQLAGSVKKEFLEMTSVFLFGATVAALVQIVLPKWFVFSFNQMEWVAIVAMMVLGFVVSICSNVDAFFALAYAQIFPTSSVLAFLVFGPMIDIKAIPMLRTMFTWRAIAMLVGLVAAMTFVLCYAYFIFV